MKYLQIAATLAMAVAVLGGCSRQEAPPLLTHESSQLTGEVVVLPEESEAGEEDTENETGGLVPNVPAPMGAALYRGVVGSVVISDGQAVATLEQAEGADYGASRVIVAIDEETKGNFHQLTDIAEGDYLEVYYGASIDGEQPEEIGAIVVNKLAGVDLNVYNGAVTEITPDETGEQGSLLLTALDSEEQILFRWDESTQFYLDFSALQPGDQVNIFYSGVATRSIPPQATALEVRQYTKVE